MENTPHQKLTITFFKTILLMGVLGAVLLLYSFVNWQSQGIDLIKNGNWSDFPGAAMTKSGVHFKPLGRLIVHQDGSVGQPNPPVNITSQPLLVKGNFTITATFLAIDKEASLRLYANPPLVYDQWRYEPPSIDVAVDMVNNLVVARVWDGTSNTSMDIRTYNVSLAPTTIISLEHIKGQITIIKDGRVLGSLPDHEIFSSGTIWLGTDGAPESNGWTLAALRLQSIGSGSVKIADAPLMKVDQSDVNSLRNLADVKKRLIKMGVAVATVPLFTDSQYRNAVLSQFSIMTPENALKPQFVHPEADVYDFSEADQLVTVALKNNITVHGHVLVYAKSNPDWMTSSPKENLQNIMVNHVETVVGHFKGKIAEWDVVNEPFSDKNALYHNGGTGLDQNIWFQALGENYIDLAFKTARQADPSAKLYLNDYGLENDGQHWDAFLALIKRLQKRQVPIDGVGFETHIYGDGDYINPSQFKNHMAVLARLGLLTRISEIDVTQDDAKQQVNQYVTALDICLRAPNCTSFTTWGLSDKYGSTTRSDRYPLVYGTSLLWDKDGKTKPAYSALQKRLQQAD